MPEEYRDEMCPKPSDHFLESVKKGKYGKRNAKKIPKKKLPEKKAPEKKLPKKRSKK